MARTRVSSHRLVLCGGLVLLVVCLPVVRSINCYQCNSFEDPDCAHVMKNNGTYDRFVKPCDGYYGGADPFCRTMTQKLQRDDPIVRVRRMCSWERSKNPCYMVDDDDHFEMVCQCFEDRCNAAPAPATLGTPTALAVLTSLVAFAFLRPH